MSNTSNVLIVANPEGILNKYPNSSKSPNNPTKIEESDKNIYYIIRNGSNGYLTKNILLNARLSDTLNLQTTTLTRDSQYNIEWYKYKLVSGNALTTSPTLITLEIQLPVPNPFAPLHSTQFQTVTSDYWSSTICDLGTSRYMVSFAILDPVGTLIGCFYFNLNLNII